MRALNLTSLNIYPRENVIEALEGFFMSVGHDVSNLEHEHEGWNQPLGCMV
jgi:hypothetical protein